MRPYTSSSRATPQYDNATYETPFGHVQRPTRKNATWDIAKNSFLFHLRLITFFWFDSWKFADIRCDFACCDLDLSSANRVTYSMRILAISDVVSPILSESKYGFSCCLALSLFRSTTAPDAEQDQRTIFIRQK